MLRLCFLLLIGTIFNSSGYSQNDVFIQGDYDSLGNKRGFHIQFLNSEFSSCDSNKAVFKHYVYFNDNKPLKHFSLPLKFLKNYLLVNKVKSSTDSLLILDGTYLFSHRRKADTLELLYKKGFLAYEKLIIRKNYPTIYLPSFKTTPKYEYYTEQRFYERMYKNYFPSYYFESFIRLENQTVKDTKRVNVYYNEEKWHESKLD